MDTAPTLPSPRPEPEAHRGGAPALQALRLGQHVIAGVLTAIGVVRAVAQDTAPALAIAAGLAIALWYGIGVALASRARSRRVARWWLIGLGVVWLAAVVVSPEFVWVAFLLWLLAGHLFTRWQPIVFAAVVYGVVAAAPVVHHGTTTWAGIIGPLVGGVFALGLSRGYLTLVQDAVERERLLASLTRAQRETAELQDELALTQRRTGMIEERTRLSRDIHDTIAQGLSSIRLLAHAAADRATGEEDRRTFGQVESLAEDSLRDVRRIVAALSPSELEEGALAAALARMLDQLREQTTLETRLHVDRTLPPLGNAAEVALLRTAQSALANVRLHAAAGRVVVSLIDAEDAVRLDIIDDGVGFDVGAWDASGTASESGYGLHFMRSRLRELGGGLEVESTPGEGTALSAYLPIHVVTDPGTAVDADLGTE